MNTPRKIASGAVIALLSLAGAIGLAVPASAGSSWIVCDSGNRAISNGNTGSTSWSQTNSDGTCGPVKMRGHVYVGGGGYSWSSTVNYGSNASNWNRTYSSTMDQSQHYWSILGNPTSKILAE